MKDGDIYINPENGKSELISGPTKTAQDVAEIIMTPLVTATGETQRRGASRREYGSELETLELEPAVSALAGKGLVAIKVSEAINRLRALQQADPTSTADERIGRVAELVVEPLSLNDFAYWVNVEVESGPVAPEVVDRISLRHTRNAQSTRGLNEVASRFVVNGEVV